MITKPGSTYKYSLEIFFVTDLDSSFDIELPIIIDDYQSNHMKRKKHILFIELECSSYHYTGDIPAR